MVRQQRTIKKSFKYDGIGLHTGKQVKTEVKPAPLDNGIVFKRIDLDPPVEIPANVDNIHQEEIRRNTTITKDGVDIHTVEHFLATAAGLHVDNLMNRRNRRTAAASLWSKRSLRSDSRVRACRLEVSR